MMLLLLGLLCIAAYITKPSDDSVTQAFCKIDGKDCKPSNGFVDKMVGKILSNFAIHITDFGLFKYTRFKTVDGAKMCMFFGAFDNWYGSCTHSL